MDHARNLDARFKGSFHGTNHDAVRIVFSDAKDLFTGSVPSSTTRNPAIPDPGNSVDYSPSAGPLGGGSGHVAYAVAPAKATGRPL